jgi:hypothetical protein
MPAHGGYVRAPAVSGESRSIPYRLLSVIAE